MNYSFGCEQEQQQDDAVVEGHTALEIPLLESSELAPREEASESVEPEFLSLPGSFLSSCPLAVLLVIQFALPYYRSAASPHLPPMGYIVSSVEVWTNVVLGTVLLTNIVTGLETLLLGTLLLSLVAGVSSIKNSWRWQQQKLLPESGNYDYDMMDSSMYKGQVRV